VNAAIANSDGATQKNAELVKVAGQSTSTLNEYAVSLLRSVSTFNLGTREYGSVKEAEAMVKDAIVFASAPESVMVQMLLQTPGIRLFDVLHADAYSRRLFMAGSVSSQCSLTADLGWSGPRIESQLPGAAPYSHCRPSAVDRWRRSSGCSRLRLCENPLTVQAAEY
jgi:hypothetical protein